MALAAHTTGTRKNANRRGWRAVPSVVCVVVGRRQIKRRHEVCDLLRREVAGVHAAQQDVEFRRLFEFFGSKNGRLQRIAGHDRPVIGEEDRGVLPRKPANGAGRPPDRRAGSRARGPSGRPASDSRRSREAARPGDRSPAAWILPPSASSADGRPRAHAVASHTARNAAVSLWWARPRKAGGHPGRDGRCAPDREIQRGIRRGDEPPAIVEPSAYVARGTGVRPRSNKERAKRQISSRSFASLIGQVLSSAEGSSSRLAMSQSTRAAPAGSKRLSGLVSAPLSHVRQCGSSPWGGARTLVGGAAAR